MISTKTNKKTLKWKVTVKKVKLSKIKLTLVKGKQAVIQLKGEKISSVKSSNKKVATVSKNWFVDEKGRFYKKWMINAKAKGQVKVTVKGKNKKKYVIKVKVVKANNTSKGKDFVAEAAAYNYTIQPVLAPFSKYFLVTTNNPHPENIRFTGTDASGEKRLLMMDERSYSDISYYNEEKKQVKKNTYIFKTGDDIYAEDEPIVSTATLEVTNDPYEPANITQSGSIVGMTATDRDFTKSEKKVAMPTGLEDEENYLIHTYADGVSGSLFDKLDAVQKGLSSLALYPKDVVDHNIKSGCLSFLGYFSVRGAKPEYAYRNLSNSR